MPDKEFLDARALSESVRLFGRLTEDGQSLVDNLTQAGLAAPEVLAAAGIDSHFIADTALPRNPTPAELAALPAGATLGGLYRPGGRVQRLVWDAQGGQWQPAGDPLPALAEVEEARAVAGDVQARVNGAPISAPGRSRGVILRGGRAFYPTDSNVPANGKTILDEPDGKYISASDAILAHEYGVLPGTSTTRRNSGAGFAAMLADVNRGMRVVVPGGFYYTDRMIESNKDNILTDFQGVLRPFTGYAGPLLKIGNGIRDTADLSGSYEQGGEWQNTATIPNLSIDGMFEARGLWMQNMDHVYAWIRVQRTRGYAALFDRIRECDISLIVKHYLAAADGEDINDPLVAAVRFMDQGDGDATNTTTTRFRGVYGRGRILSIDSRPITAGYPNTARMLTFTAGGQYEALGYPLAFGDADNKLPPYSAGEKVYIGSVNGVEFDGNFSMGSQDNGTSAWKIGDQSRGKIAYNVRIRGSLYGSGNSSVTMFNFDNVRGYELDVDSTQLGGGARISNLAAGATARTRYTERQEVVASDGALRLTGLDGIGRSAALEFYSRDGAKAARTMLDAAGQFILQAEMGSANYIQVDRLNRLSGNGADLQLGVTNLPVGQVCHRVRTASPTELPPGTTAVADGTTWDPLGRGSGPYMALWDGTMWRVP